MNFPPLSPANNTSRPAYRVGVRPFAGSTTPATLQIAQEADAWLAIDNWPEPIKLPAPYPPASPRPLYPPSAPLGT